MSSVPPHTTQSHASQPVVIDVDELPSPAPYHPATSYAREVIDVDSEDDSSDPQSIAVNVRKGLSVSSTPVSTAHRHSSSTASILADRSTTRGSNAPDDLKSAHTPILRPQVSFPKRPWKKLDPTADTVPRFGHHQPSLNRVSDPPSGEYDKSGSKIDQLDLGELDSTFWTGKDSEDRISEQTIKLGYTDKASLLNEGNGARSSLWPLLKTKAGLDNVNSFFSSVLRERQEIGRITSPSSFRPPPRVTLTDSKRETWLKELADDSIPLRRLSRSIPQRLRGKLLLEQCAAKKIALPRAIWLCKCVGVNELRAFRRKGVSMTVAAANESKWVKEWTTVVVGFLEDTLDTAVVSASKDSLQYVLRLVVQLLQNDLIDGRYFITWLAEQLRESDCERLPAIVFLIHVYWKHIHSSLLTGQTVANACASRIGKIIHSGNRNILYKIVKRLMTILKNFCLTRPIAVLLLDEWPECKKAIEVVSEDMGSKGASLLHRISTISEGLSQLSKPPQKSLSIHLASILDSFGPRTDPDKLTARCIIASSHPRTTMMTVIQWATSLHCYGEHRPYLAANIIRQFKVHGIHTDDLILDALGDLSQVPWLSGRLLGRLLTDLTMSHDFNVASYFRWLIANGLVRGSDIDDLSFALRPAVDFPSPYLSHQALSMRKMVLRSAQASHDEDDCFSDLKEDIEQALLDSGLSEPQTLNIFRKVQALTPGSEINLSVSTNLASWLEEILSDLTYSRSDELEISSNAFVLIRSIFEHFGDYKSLASAMLKLLPLCGTEAFVSVADTMHRWFLPFTAMKLSIKLSTALFDKYRLLKLRTGVNKDSVSAIMPLATYMGDVNIIRFFEQEQELILSNSVFAACTPASDSFVDITISSGGVCREEELERIFSSGATMDESTVKRVFELVTNCASNAVETQEQSLLCTAGFFARLRAFDILTFDDCMRSWILSQLSVNDCRTLDAFVPYLIGLDCLSMSTLLECSARTCIDRHAPDEPSCFKTAEDVLNMIAIEPSLQAQAFCRPLYKFATEQSQLPYNSLEQTVSLVRHASYCGTHRPDRFEASWFKSACILGTLRQQCCQNGDLWPIALDRHRQEYLTLITTLLGSPNQPAPSDPRARVKYLIIHADPFMIRVFVQALVRTIQDSKPADDLQTMTLEALQEAVLINSLVWQDIVSSLPRSIAVPMCSLLEEDLFNELADIQRNFWVEESRFKALRGKCSIIQTVKAAFTESRSVESAVTLSRECASLADKLHQGGTDASINMDTNFDVLLQCFDVAIELCPVYASSFDPSPMSSMALSSLFLALSPLLHGTDKRLNIDLRQRLLETVAFLLVTNPLSHELLTQLEQRLGKSSRNPTLRFLFGFRDQPDAWLHLTTSSMTSPIFLSHAHVDADQATPSTNFSLRQWDLFPDATPDVGTNDAALSLRLFGARKLQ